MAEQRMVPVELLERILLIAQHLAPSMSAEISSIIDGPGVEPAVYDWSHFYLAYHKACNTSQGQDWLDAALLAQQVRNQSPSVPVAHCHECGKLASDGWALYCVKCAEKIGPVNNVQGTTVANDKDKQEQTR